MENVTQLTAFKKTTIKQEWPDIRKQLIWAFIVNLGIGIGIIVQMYYNQKLIMYRLDTLEANQEAINAEIINLYQYAR